MSLAKNQRAGFSIGTLMAGIALSGVVLVVAAKMIRDVTQRQSYANSQAILDGFQSLAQQSAAAPQRWTSFLKNHPTLASKWTQIETCFKGAGQNCTQFESTPTPIKYNAADGSDINPSSFQELNRSYSSSTQKPCTAGAPNCDIKRTATYRIVCPFEATCDGIEVEVKTEAVSASASKGLRPLSPRSATLGIQGLSLAGAGSAVPDFSCATSALISNITQGGTALRPTYTAQCAGFSNLSLGTPPTPSILAGFGPRVATADLYAPLDAKTCDPSVANEGVAQIGPLKGQSSCKQTDYKIPRLCSALPESSGGYVIAYNTSPAPGKWDFKLDAGKRVRQDGGEDPNAAKTCTVVTETRTNFTVPAGVTEIFAQLWGAGGGGGRGGTSAGGGGGGFIAGSFPVSPGGNVTVVIGSGGGAAGQVMGQAGKSGSASKISYNGVEMMKANPGSGGSASDWCSGSQSNTGGDATAAAGVTVLKKLKADNKSSSCCGNCGGVTGAPKCAYGNKGHGGASVSDNMTYQAQPGKPGAAQVYYVQCL
jgi:Tfp pilus assembly protein FimT